VSKIPIYWFYWDDGEEGFLMEIDADVKTVKKLLSEYRREDEYYDNIGWYAFLSRKGIKARFLEPDHKIYF